MRKIGKFHKVSFRRFREDWKTLLPVKIQADIREIYQGIRLPQRATGGSAGYDFYAPVEIALQPGESITIYPYMYHDFHVEEGTGAVLLGEVSMCNDDENDNRFYEPIGRFPAIEEDEPAYRLLCNEYPAAE